MSSWQPRNFQWVQCKLEKAPINSMEKKSFQRLLQTANPGSCSVSHCSFDTSRDLCWMLLQKLLSLFTLLLQLLEELDVEGWINLVSAPILPSLKSVTQIPIIPTKHGQNWSLWWRILKILEESKLKTFQQVVTRTRWKHKANFFYKPSNFQILKSLVLQN